MNDDNDSSCILDCYPVDYDNLLSCLMSSLLVTVVSYLARESWNWNEE